MQDNIIDVDEIPEKGITVTTVVIDGLTETTIRRSAAAPGVEEEFDQTGIALIQNPHAAGDPRLQHDLAIRDVYAGKYGDFSAKPIPEAAP
jgi:formylmethanofuran:tetrahydromethanopterin formyltransferase